MSDTVLPFRNNVAVAQTIRDPEWMLSGPYETSKTYGALARLDAEARANPGGNYAMVRKYRADMDATVLVTWRRLTEGRRDIVAYGGEKPQWYDYANGSRIWVGGMDRPGRTLSGERDGVYVNQAEELSEDEWQFLIRATTGRGAVTDTPMIWGDCNPGSADHWIVRRSESGALTRLDTTHRDNPALYDDDGALTAQGHRTMTRLSQLTGMLYLRGFLGQWVGAEGMYYTQLAEERHIAPNRAAEPWEHVWAALDYGFIHPLAFGVFAYDAEQDIVTLLGAHHQAKWYLAQHAVAWADVLATCGVSPHGLRIVAGHDCWATSRDDPETIADKCAALGYPLERATISRVQGARALGERFGNPDCEPPLAPRLVICERARHVFDALTRMVHDPRNAEDVSKTDADAHGRGGDDDYDMLRYGVMATPVRTYGWQTNPIAGHRG